jgi:hypothetical protein
MARSAKDAGNIGRERQRKTDHFHADPKIDTDILQRSAIPLLAHIINYDYYDHN